jgi:hypothetical protein
MTHGRFAMHGKFSRILGSTTGSLLSTGSIVELSWSVHHIEGYFEFFKLNRDGENVDAN